MRGDAVIEPSIDSADLMRIRRRRRPWLCWTVLLLIQGCKREVAPAKPVAAVSSSSAIASSAPTTRDSRFAAVQRLVEEWRQSQNELDFESYAALYAPTFLGTKRVGGQTFRFDRRRWLADRKPMFGKGLRVTVTQLELVVSGPNVVAFFQQAFETPAFRDRGRKLLAFARGEHGLQIVREELLSSHVEGGGGSVASLPGFFFARPEGVVLRSQLDDRWLTPARRELARQLRAAREDPEQQLPWPEEDFVKPNELLLPAEITAFSDKKLYVTRAPVDGVLPAPCEANVTRIGLHNSAAASFESVRGGMHYDHLFGVVVLGHFQQPCPGALWASETPPGTQYLPEAASGLLLEAARRAFRAKVSYPVHDATIIADGPARRLLFVRGWLDHDDGQRDTLNLLFSLDGDSLSLLPLGALDIDVVPRLAFDADGDGTFEVLTQPGGDWSTVSVLQVKGRTVALSPVYSEPDFVCPG